MDNGPPLAVEVWGDFACFTRPEMKVERVSYPCITPSAARGVLEAILWKPEFKWVVRRIDVLQPIRYFSLTRNEVKSKAAVSSARAGRILLADEDRTQRHTLGLRDVAYVIHADVVLAPHAAGEHPAKYRDQFRRRIGRGRCHRQPYLGCREFSAFFGPPSGRQPAAINEELGPMLLDIDYAPGGSGRGTPRFFEAALVNGSLRVPPAEEGGHVA
jgi:CRISPR-associated protein Cas5d